MVHLVDTNDPHNTYSLIFLPVTTQFISHAACRFGAALHIQIASFIFDLSLSHLNSVQPVVLHLQYQSSRPTRLITILNLNLNSRSLLYAKV